MKIKVGRSQNYTLIDEEDYIRVAQKGYYFCNSDRGYVILKKPLGGNKYKEVYLHRFIMDFPKDLQVDHINRDKLDNRKENLRICTGAENSRNREQNKGNFKGVHYSKKNRNWVAQITKDYHVYHLGSFSTEIEGAIAYNQKAIELHGEYAYQNKI